MFSLLWWIHFWCFSSWIGILRPRFKTQSGAFPAVEKNGGHWWNSNWRGQNLGHNQLIFRSSLSLNIFEFWGYRLSMTPIFRQAHDPWSMSPSWLKKNTEIAEISLWYHWPCPESIYWFYWKYRMVPPKLAFKFPSTITGWWFGTFFIFHYFSIYIYIYIHIYIYWE